MERVWTLNHGSSQVEKFGDDSEYEQLDGEVVEEVEYVTLDLGSIEPTLVPSTSSYRLIGLDGPTPFLQLSGTVFKGEHQALLGTELLFTDSKDDRNERNHKGLTHVANTERRIRFKEVELRPKNNAQDLYNIEISPGEAVSVPSKRKFTGSVEELVGNESAETSSRGKSKRSRGNKGKGRELGEHSIIMPVDTAER
ncbi:hypothetical protein BC835DRAFT_711120 [Cytidiella melzeri]|nr:hypothetical protein BC835DRAFT_711120 [Cytidiella melzeri]